MTGETRLIRAHRPSGILLIGSNRHQSRIRWELTLPSSSLKRCTDFCHGLMPLVMVTVAVAMAMTGSLDHRDET
jgi:hypothetical protein